MVHSFRWLVLSFVLSQCKTHVENENTSTHEHLSDSHTERHINSNTIKPDNIVSLSTLRIHTCTNLRVAEGHQEPALEHEEGQHQHEPAPGPVSMLVDFREELWKDCPKLEADGGAAFRHACTYLLRSLKITIDW